MIAVLGSANVDLVFRLQRFPHFGETIPGISYARFPGGKGANQAVACARLGATTWFFGKLGDDPFGLELLQSLNASGVNTSSVNIEKGTHTGTAAIFVSPEGHNAILYFPGANALIDEVYVDKALDKIMSSSILLLQFEIPVKTIAYLLRKLPPDKPFVILDPAPVYDLTGFPLDRIDILTPNVTELRGLTGTEDIKRGGEKLLKLGARQVLCKVGENGAWLIRPSEARHFPAFKIEAVDTTAAGDAFNGALAVALDEGLPIEESIEWANAAGALACTREGAQSSLPYREELEAFLKGKTKRGLI
ncbi:MAG: ribokinase [Candidatus Methanomethyliaceae archaeon]